MTEMDGTATARVRPDWNAQLHKNSLQHTQKMAASFRFKETAIQTFKSEGRYLFILCILIIVSTKSTKIIGFQLYFKSILQN